MKCNSKLRPCYFSVNISVLALVFRRQIKKTNNFTWNCQFFEFCQRNAIASTEKKLEHNFALHFTSFLSIALFKILPHSKTIKIAKKFSIFGENDSRCLSNSLQNHIFWNFDHISRTCNEINYRNIWFEKVIIIFIMTAQLLFFNVFFRKRPAPWWRWAIWNYSQLLFYPWGNCDQPLV